MPPYPTPDADVARIAAAMLAAVGACVNGKIREE